jgi:hypothetical protein
MLTASLLACTLFVGSMHQPHHSQLRGHVVSGGSAVPGVTITVVMADGKPRYAITNSDGNFSFDVTLGTHCIRAELPGFSTVETSISEGSAPAEIELLPISDAVITVSCVLPNFISCRVVSSADGKPLEGAELQLTIADDDSSSSSGFTDAQGEAWFAVGGNDVRPYRLVVRKKAHRSADIRGVLPGVGLAVNIALEPE